MYLFPLDTNVTSTDQAGSTLTGTLLPAASFDRQMVYCHITCSTGDCHLSLGSTTSTPEMQLCDTEGANVVDNFSPIVITSGTPVVWDKANTSVRANYHLSFVNYRLVSSTPPELQYSSWGLTILLVIVSLLFIDFIRRIWHS